MIVAHFFLRNVRKKPTLFVETTSSQGLEQPVPAAQALCEVSEEDNRRTWIRKAYYAFTKKFKGLVLVDALDTSLRLESDHPSFDLVFRPESMGPGLTEELRKEHAKDASVSTVIRNLFGKKKEAI